jgi:ribosomal protein S27AE
MTPTTDDIRVHCAKCGSADIRERNVAYAELPVIAWEREADGGVKPADYETDVSADWEPDDVSHQYVCGNCGERYRIDQLTEAK